MRAENGGDVDSTRWGRVRKHAPAVVAGVIVVVVLLGMAFVNAASYLEGPAQAPSKADAAFVLGGDSGDRALRAAELYRAGFASVFVLSGMEDVIDEVRLAYVHWRVQVLAHAGVPESAMVLDMASSNSEEEALFGLRLARERGWKRVMVVSDPPHMRRLKLLWGRAFTGSGIELQLVATRPKWWAPDRWWSSRKSAQFIVQEYIKLAYAL